MHKVNRALEVIKHQLESNNIKWALVGSTNLQLQGLQVDPRDLDIIVQFGDLEKIKELFSATAVRQLDSLSGNPAWEVIAMINDVEVQFVGADEKDVYVSRLLANNITYRKLNNVKIPCFTLEAEAECYEKTNRAGKARMIRDFLMSSSQRSG